MTTIKEMENVRVQHAILKYFQNMHAQHKVFTPLYVERACLFFSLQVPDLTLTQFNRAVSTMKTAGIIEGKQRLCLSSAMLPMEEERQRVEAEKHKADSKETA